MELIDSDKRIFEGFATVDIKDSKGEKIPLDDVLRHMDAFIEMGGNIIERHTNKIVGKVLHYGKQRLRNEETGEEFDGLLIRSKIYDYYKRHHDVWNKIKEGIYKGLSIGGDQSEKNNLEYGLFEISVCEQGTNPLAKIVSHSVAKSKEVDNMAENDKKEEENTEKEEEETEEKPEKEFASVEELAKLGDSVMKLQKELTELKNQLKPENEEEEGTKDAKKEETISVNKSELKSIVEEAVSSKIQVVTTERPAMGVSKSVEDATPNKKQMTAADIASGNFGGGE